MCKRWWQVLLTVSLFGCLLTYAGWKIWQRLQQGEFTLPTLLAVVMLVLMPCLIGMAALPYRKEILVAIVGMVVGAIAGGCAVRRDRNIPHLAGNVAR